MDDTGISTTSGVRDVDVLAPAGMTNKAGIDDSKGCNADGRSVDAYIRPVAAKEDDPAKPNYEQIGRNCVMIGREGGKLPSKHLKWCSIRLLDGL